MSSKPKDHTKTIATMKTVIADLKKNVNKITKEKEKADSEKEQQVSPEEHKAALDHFASQYKMAKVNKDEAAASEHAKAYHAYAAKLNAHYHSKLKEDVEQVDEISKELANRYMHSAFSDRKRTDDKMFALRDREDTLGHKNRNKITKLLKKSDKRTTGISRALQRITNEEQSIMEVGQNFRRGNALRAAINAMSPEERKAYEEKRAEQQRKRDEARLARERLRNTKEEIEICNQCKSDPCICDESHGFVNEAAGTKPGWMLKQDPALAKKLKEKQKIAKARKASYGDPSKGISMNPYKIQEGKMGEKAAGDLDFNPEVKHKESDDDHFAKQSPKMQTAINLHLRKGKSYKDAVSAAKVHVKEEAEQVDELNVMTLSKYAAKARAQSMDKNNPKRYKRGSGAAKAYDKIHRGDYSEETNPYSIHDIQNIDEKLTVGGGAARRVTTSQGVSVVTNTPAKKPQTNKPAQKPMSALDRATARLKEAVSKYTDPRVDKEMKATKKEYEHRAKHFAAKKAGDEATAAKEHSRMKKFQSFASKINAARRADSPSDNSAAIAKDYKDQEAKRGIGKVRD
jgi:hypothetical protein